MQKNIAIVERDPEVRKMLTDFFSSKGQFQVQAYEDVFNAKNAWNSTQARPDIFVLSLKGLEESNGFQFVDECRATTPNLPIVLLCEKESTAPVSESMKHGDFRYVLKPATAEAVGFAVDIALQRAQSSTAFGGLFNEFPTIGELEKNYMKIVLEKTKGRKERAAKILGINRRTLYRKEREYGWVAEEEAPPQQQQASH